MRVLLTNRPGGAYGHISESWGNALRSVNCTVARWDGLPASWQAFDPDLYLGCSGHRQPIPVTRRAKIALHVNPYSRIALERVAESPGAIAWVKEVRPDVVFGYGDASVAKYWDGWCQAGYRWVPMPTAGDSTLYAPGTNKRDLDFAYIGGYWPYKATNLARFLLPLFGDRSYRIEVRGWGSWPAAIRAAPIPIDDDAAVVALLRRARVGPCISEPHTCTYGIDVPERVWKVALAGALPVHDWFPTAARLLPGLPVCRSPGEYITLCKRFCRDESTRASLAAALRRQVLAAHTYHHRLGDLVAALGFPDLSDRLLAYARALQ